MALTGKKPVLWIVLFLLKSFAAFSQKPVQIKYTVSPFWVDSIIQLKISCQFKTGPVTQTRIEIPKGYGGQNSFQKCISRLKLLNKDAEFSPTDTSHIKIIRHKPGTVVKFEYVFSNPVGLSPDENVDADVLPQFTKNSCWFFGIGTWIIHVVPGEENYQAGVEINWTGFPKGFELANSFGFNQKRQVFKGLIADFTQSGFLGGTDYRYLSFKLKDKPVIIGIHKKIAVGEQELQQAVEKVLYAECSFWNDFSFKNYFISITLPFNPGDRDGSSVGGTSAKNAFFATAAGKASLTSLIKLFTHEIFHNWNPVKLGKSIEPKPTWFTEGFTEYFTPIILFNAQLKSYDQLVNEWNQKLVKYYNSPVLNAPLDTMNKYFFSSYNYQSLPYNKGFIIAMHWDYALKKKSGGKWGLRDVLTDMLTDSKIKKLDLGTEFLCAYVGRYLERDLLAEVNNSWIDGKTFPFDYSMKFPFLKVDSTTVYEFEIGFDTDQTYRTKIISGVKPGSNAYKAGLRDGMRLVDDFYRQNDASIKAKVMVVVDGEQKDIVYFPKAERSRQVPTFSIDTTGISRDSIVNYFKLSR